jgi:hypothetical protein
MSQDVVAVGNNSALACSTCNAKVGELRRGRCWTCYTRWAEQRPVGLGACCAVCDERRRDNLRLMEVQGRTLPLCHLCAARVGKLDLVPHSIEGLRAALRRDRRQLERREDGDDEVVGTDRRAVQRRMSLASSAGIGGLDEDASVWVLGEVDLELDVEDNDIVEATVVAELAKLSLQGSTNLSPPPTPVSAEAS